MKVKVFFVFMFILLACNFTGCTNVNDIYNESKVKSQYNKLFDKDSYEEVVGLTTGERIHYYGLKILKKEKLIAATVAIISIIIGLLIFKAFEKENKIRKTVISVFWVGIPIFCTLITVLLVVIVRFTGK